MRSIVPRTRAGGASCAHASGAARAAARPTTASDRRVTIWNMFSSQMLAVCPCVARSWAGNSTLIPSWLINLGLSHAKAVSNATENLSSLSRALSRTVETRSKIGDCAPARECICRARRYRGGFWRCAARRSSPCGRYVQPAAHTSALAFLRGEERAVCSLLAAVVANAARMDSGLDWRNAAEVSEYREETHVPVQDATRFHPRNSDLRRGSSQCSTGAIPTSDNALWSANRA